MFRFTVAVAAALAVALLFALPLGAFAKSPRAANAPCVSGGYSYSGYGSTEAVSGVSATVAAAARPAVRSGHVAAWVGVGGVHLGPRGTNEWLQVGLAAFPGSAQRIYYELVVPGAPRRYAELDRRLAPGERVRVAVVERAPNLWQVVVDGRPVAAPVRLPASHAAWRGIATAESWAAGRKACNRYAYRFRDVTVATAGGVWHWLASGLRIGRVTRTPSAPRAFLAAA